MVSENDKSMAQKVLMSYFHSGGDSVQLADVCQGTKQFGTKLLAEESNWMTVLHQHDSHV